MKEETKLPAVIEGRFNLALTQSNFQKLHDEAGKLVFNEDNLEEISEFLNKLRKVEKEIEKVHKDGKSEALKIGRDWDAAKRVFLEQVANAGVRAQQEYKNLCIKIDQRIKSEQEEIQRKNRIKEGIESNALRFATMIANCETNEDLISTERLINLEKANKNKYGEFTEDAIQRFDELKEVLIKQKAAVKELEKLKESEAKAKSDEETIAIREKIDQVQVDFELSKHEVQEKAIEQAMEEETVQVAQTIFPPVKARRTTWKWEVIKIEETQKKMPSWIKIEVDESKINDYLKAKREEGIKEEEFEVAGIRFFQQKTW